MTLKGKQPIEEIKPRELAVLELLAQGLTYEEIAKAMNTSIFTVKRRMNDLFYKLDTKKAHTVVAWYYLNKSQ